MTSPAPTPPAPAPRARPIALVLGPVLALLVAWLLPPTFDPPQRACAGVATLMAVWWLGEAIPLAATSLLPLVLFPILDIMSTRDTAARYAHPIIFLFLGGFVLALAMQRSGLHTRIALRTVLIVGTSPLRMLAGFMLATATLSMFVSNTATAIMLVPIAMSVVEMVRSHEGDEHRERALATSLLLGIAYAASIGGIGTLIGTPPNTVLAAMSAQRLGVEIGFAQWMLVGVPVVAIFLPLCWVYLALGLKRAGIPRLDTGRRLIRAELDALGPMSRAEWTTFIVFCITAALWITRPMLQRLGESASIAPLTRLDDTIIAMAGALSLFLLPAGNSKRVMDWQAMADLPWGILLLFGGGLALAGAMGATGLDIRIGSAFIGLEGTAPAILIGATSTIMIFLTELTSNTAVTNAMLPVLESAGETLGIDPLQLMAPAAIAASCAFMLPVATPPNAVVFASGRVTIAQMARAGLVLNLIGIVVVTLASLTLVPAVLG